MLRFLNPTAFAALALALPILLLYLLKLRRRETVISSVFLWQQVLQDAEANTPWQRLRRNLLLYLQLLILAALALTLARPFTIMPVSASGKVALLLDASASMNARDLAGGSRFDEAKRRALEIVNGMGAGDSLLLIRVGALPEIILPFSDNREQLRAAIQGLEAGAGRVDWDSAFALTVAEQRSETSAERVIVISDGGFGDIRAHPNWREVEWDFIAIGNAAENTAISQLATAAIAAEPPQLFASLDNFGDRAAERIVSLWLDGDLIHSRRIKIAAGASQPFLYTLPDGVYRELELRLTVPLAAETPDYLPDDDRAFATRSARQSARVLLFSAAGETGAEANIFLERALASMPATEVLRANPALAAPGQSYDLTVYDGWLPEPEAGLPAGDLLFINPPRETVFFQLGGWHANPAPLRADPQNPIGQFVDLSNVSLLRAREILPLGNWAQTVIRTAGGEPVLLAGERDGRQIAALSFDLRDSDLPLWIAWPVLIANLTRWYQADDFGAASGPAGGDAAIFHAPLAADAVRVTAPDGEESLHPLRSAEFAVRDTSRAGIYRLDWLANEQVIGSDRFAVNLFAAAESDIRPRPPLLDDGTPFRAAESDSLGQREWWWLFAAGALAALLLEWWLYCRRNRLPTPRRAAP